MDLKEAIARSTQILDEERLHPTVEYRVVRAEPGMVRYSTSLLAILALPTQRSQRPRQIDEDTGMYRFGSTNYELLGALLSQLPETDQPQYKHFVGLRLVWGVGCVLSTLHVHPKWNSLVSELPLTAEFLVRNGAKSQLLSTLRKEGLQIVPGHMLLLMQLEEMIALNYFIFTEPEYEELSSASRQFSVRVGVLLKECVDRRAGYVRYPDIGQLSLRTMYQDMLGAAKGLIEQCRKARYLYLKGSLLQGLNLEINQDKAAVETYLDHLGFSKVLVESLNEADRLHRQPATAFDLKASVGHLRSFLESLQQQVIPVIHKKYGGILPATWGAGLAYLSAHKILSKTEEHFAAAFYTLISDEGVHPLIADQEYARLARNMVIEYALLFLRKVDKLGISLRS